MAGLDQLRGGSKPLSLRGRAGYPVRFNFVTSAVFLLLFLLVGRSVLPSSEVVLPAAHVEKRSFIYDEDPVAFNKSLHLHSLEARAGDPNDPPWTKRVSNGNRSRASLSSTLESSFAVRCNKQRLIYVIVLVLYCMMGSTSTTQSGFTKDDLTSSGWERIALTKSNGKDFQDNSFEAYDDASLGTNRDTDDAVGYLHMNEWINTNDNNKEEDPTWANFQNLFNRGAGYMLAGNNVSPSDAKKDNEDLVLPPVRSWSDVMAIEWGSGNTASALNFVIRSGITNDNTKAMIKQAHLTTGRNKVPKWPGVDFSMADDNTEAQTEAFYGLLGTYHGAGVGYMLAQNQGVFGRRRVERIRTWALTSDWDITGNTLQNCGMILFISAVQ